MAQTIWVSFCYTAMSKVYLLKTVQKIPADINTVWNFFFPARQFANYYAKGNEVCNYHSVCK